MDETKGDDAPSAANFRRVLAVTRRAAVSRNVREMMTKSKSEAEEPGCSIQGASKWQITAQIAGFDQLIKTHPESVQAAVTMAAKITANLDQDIPPTVLYWQHCSDGNP